jgi:hypothetical protein
LIKIDDKLSKNTEITEDGKGAERRDAMEVFNNAFVGIDVPYELDQCYYEVCVTKAIEDKWAGSIRMYFVPDLANIAGGDLVASGTTCGRPQIPTGARIGLLFSPRLGTCCYFKDGQPFGAPFSYLSIVNRSKPEHPRRLYGVFEIYGRCAAVRLLHTHATWSPETHAEFPLEFRRTVRVLLLCHRRQDGGSGENLIASLPKFVLFDIFVLLADLYDSAQIPSM